MRLIDADALKKDMCSTCDNRERCEDREQVCSEIANIDEQPTIEAEPLKHGRWIFKEKTKLIPTGEMAVTEGHILSKTSNDKPFKPKDVHLIALCKHKTVREPYCSECGVRGGDDEYDITPYCPNCGARMDSKDGDGA